MRLGLSVFQLAIAAAVHFSPSGFAACSMEQRAFYISKVYEAAHGAASFRGTTALICNARIGNSLDRSGLYAEKGGQHGLELAGLGCVDILRTLFGAAMMAHVSDGPLAEHRGTWVTHALR